jgi:hypothetical protein
MENLARRKDHEGRPFLERDLIKAGLRLHEEFRLTGCEEQIEPILMICCVSGVIMTCPKHQQNNVHWNSFA